MINLFTFAAKDQSLLYLAQIFGSVNGVIPAPNQASITGHTTGGDISILGTMFQTFNTVVLVVGVLIVVYTTFIGVMATAHEGEFLGKHWHKLWTPLRMVLGIATLVPTGSGYSGIQIIVMWVIIQGIGAADAVWNTALNYVNVTGSAFTQATIPSVDVTIAMRNLFQGMVCDASLRESGPNPDTVTQTPGPYFCTPVNGMTPDAAFCNQPAPEINTGATNVNSLPLGPGGACGQLNYCKVDEACAGAGGTESLKCVSCKAQVKALATIVDTMYVLAQTFVQTDYSYRNFYFNNKTDASPNDQTGFNTSWLNGFCAEKGFGSLGTECCVPGRTDCQSQENHFAAYLPYSDPEGGNPGKNFGASTPTITKLYWTYSLGPKVNSGNFIQVATREYVQAVSTAVNTYISSRAATATITDPRLAEARDYGWIMAGGYYYFVAQANGKNLQDSIPSISAPLPQNSPEAAGSQYANYRVNYTAAAILEKHLQDVATGPGGVQPTPRTTPAETGPITNAIGEMMLNIESSMKPDPEHGTAAANPLMQMQAAGDIILIVVQITYVVLLILTLVIGIVSGLNGFILGTGMMNPASTGMIMVYFLLMPAVVGLLGVLLALGATLAIYIPLIPFTIFVMGAIGWMLSVIEAMVAAPLVALGILSPGGRHELLGSAEPALMLLFSVFLRPALMIFGLIAAMLLASVVMIMINKAIWTIVMDGILGTSGMAAGPLGFIIFLCAYVSLVVAAMNKCFEAIHWIPEKVMRWIGGQGEQYGEGATVGEMKRGVEAGASGAQRAGEGAKKGVEEGTTAGLKGRAEKAKRAQESGPSAAGKDKT
jgi:hypothetical protein